MKMLPRNVHAVTDYLAGITLVAAPWIFGFSQYATPTNVTMAVGVMTLIYSIFTRYESGLVRLIPFPAHMLLDLLSGLLLMASPWIFGFQNIVYLPQVIFGAFEIGVAILTSNRPAYHETHSRGRRHRHA